MSRTIAAEAVPYAVQRVAERVRASGRTPAVVVNVGWVSGLAAVRSLGRRGIPVVALHRNPSGLGLQSRYAFPLIGPDPGLEEERFVALLVALGSALRQRAPIFPTHDEDLDTIARHADALEELYRFPFPEWELLERIQSKRFQLAEAEAAGVPTPRTAHPGSASDAQAAGRELGFPVLVKPSAPSGFRRAFRRQAFRCENQDELDLAYSRAEPFEPMVQELIPGEDSELYTLGSYLRADGTPLGLFSGRKLRQHPPGVGTCRVGEAVWVDEVVEQGLRLLARLGFRGISQVEFKRDARDGRYKLMEVNPRLWQWHGLAAACGVDLASIAYRDLLGDPVEAVRSRGCGKRWAISVMSGAGLAVQRPPYVDAVLAADDLRPAVVQAVRVVRRALR